MFPHWKKPPETTTDWFQALIDMARHLRGPGGCPWDREHTTAEFAIDAVGEARELVEAIETGDNRHAEEEFGDVLFVLLALAAAAEEEGRFDLDHALRQAHEKMIRRHAHVFGDAKADTAEDVKEAWQRAKEAEKGQ